MASEAKFKKEQILKSKQFSTTDKYLLKAILEDKEYTIKQVQTLLDKEKKRGVK